MRRIRISRRVPPSLAALLAASLLALPAAGQPQSGASAPVPPQAESGATIRTERNVYLAGGQVRPAGPVEGDLSAAGGRVIVDQPVRGDLAMAGGSVEVRAPVGDDVRAIGGDVRIEGAVAGEVFATGGNVSIARQASVGQGARLYGANVTVEGRVDGPLKVAAQRVVVNSEIRGDASLTAEEVELGPAARIGGALRYTAATFRKAEGAVVSGAEQRDERPAPEGRPHHRGMEGDWPRHAGAGWGQGASWGGTVFAFLAMLAFTALLLALAPQAGALTADRIRTDPLPALGIGLGVFLAVPMLCMLLFITLLGIPVAMLVMSVFPLLLLVGFAIGVLFVAGLARRALRRPEPPAFSGRIGYAALALLAVLLLARVPFVGGLLFALLTLAGMGAIGLEWRTRRRARSAPASGA